MEEEERATKSNLAPCSKIMQLSHGVVVYCGHNECAMRVMQEVALWNTPESALAAALLEHLKADRAHSNTVHLEKYCFDQARGEAEDTRS